MKNMILLFIIGIILLLHSCATESSIKDTFLLQPTDTYLNFPIDEDTRLPKYCLWTFEDAGKEYLAFPNGGKEILFYDIESESLLKKSEYMFEGVDGVGYIHSFSITDFDHIYIPSMNEPIIYETDTTSRIRTKIRYGKTDKGLHLLPTEFCINSPMIILGDHFYISQYRNRGLGEKCLTESPRGVMIDRITEKGIITPLKYIIPVENMQDAHLLTSGDGGSVCFDGENLVYSYELIDTVYTLSTDFSVIKKYPAKSKFIEETKFEVVRNATLEQKLKRICELPIYGNIIYDKYRDVYYRFTFPEVEMDKEKSYLDIFHSGRKQFSIIILDKNMNIVGETLFPEYTYNPNLVFIRKDGLYLSISHVKRLDFDENTLRFQKIELVEM